MLHEKVAFITGSSRGIGRAIAELFAASGASVVLHARQQSQTLEDLAHSIREKYNVRTDVMAADVTDARAMQQVFLAIFRTFGHLDVLVNNAGMLEPGLIGMLNVEKIRYMFEVNTIASILCLQEASRLMGRVGGGSIINVSSIVGIEGSAGMAVYSATKAALIGLTRSAAKELAPKKIRVNAIAPGFIETDLIAGFSEEQKTSIVNRIGLRRPGQPADVAQAALFLASDQSSYVTGQVLGVDGGMVV